MKRINTTLKTLLGIFILCSSIGTGCIPDDIFSTTINPFQDLPPIELDGEPQQLTTTIAPLGFLAEGDVIRLKVTGNNVEAVSILIEDQILADAGVIAGGGPPNTFFEYRIQISARYFVFVQFNPATNENEQLAVLTAMPGDSTFQPPEKQSVVITFEDNYLTDPGLTDPDSFTAEETQLLADISDLVRQEIMTTLRSIFDGTPVEIIDQNDPLPSGPYSLLTLSPDRVLADNQAVFDAAIPSVDPDSPCAVPVIFGEILPRGSKVDPGNNQPDDRAVVYVGSFQGRGLECRSAAVESVNNIVLALSHTAAHEIGHLIGLYHVALVDIMDRRPTAAFQRQLSFGRAQTLLEIPVTAQDGSIQLETRVQTNIIQDPDIYFQTNFSPNRDRERADF